MPRPYPREFRDDVVRVARNCDDGVTIEQIATDFGVHPMTLTKWMRQADIDEGTQLTAASPPASGLPFQPTTAAVSGFNALVSAAGAALTARTQQAATGMTTASATYSKQEATNAADMSNVTGVTVV